MFILDQADIPTSLVITTPEGEKKGVFYRGHLFTLAQTFEKMTRAASYCRSLLDANVLSIVTEVKTTSQESKLLVWREISLEEPILSISPVS